MDGPPQSRRGLLLSAIALAASGSLLLVAARLPQGETPDDPEAHASLLRAMGWLLLAAIAALFASTGWVRRAVGVVICGAGLTAGAALVWSIAGGDPRSDMGSDMGGDMGAALWIVAVLIGGALALVAGVGVIARGGRWPGWSRRFDAATETRPTDPLDQWRALDRGEDPTR